MPRPKQQRARFDLLKQKLVSWLQSLSQTSTCSNFFNSDSYRNPYFGQLVMTLQNQQAYDALQTDISQYDAGMWNTGMQSLATFSLLKNTPVCDELRGAKKGVVVAFSPLTTDHNDVYINTSLLKKMTQGTLLHEVLHDLTGLEDFVDLRERKEKSPPAPYDLKTFVGIETNPGTDPSPGITNDITVQLENKGCVNPN